MQSNKVLLLFFGEFGKESQEKDTNSSNNEFSIQVSSPWWSPQVSPPKLWTRTTMLLAIVVIDFDLGILINNHVF